MRAASHLTHIQAHLLSPGPLHLWQPAWQPVHTPAALA